MIKINGKDLPKYPSAFTPTVSDLDNGETTQRTMDGLLHRDRIAVKIKLALSFNLLKWSEIAEIMQMIGDEFFEVTYPDIYTGAYETKTFYVGDRSSPLALIRDGEMYWQNLSFNLIER